jgi:hypothetical protein
VGILRFLGFSIPLAVALDLNKTPDYDARPMGGRCSLCKRAYAETYKLTRDERICVGCVTDIVRRSGPRRITTPRPVGDWPFEMVRDPADGKYVELDPWWDKQLG